MTALYANPYNIDVAGFYFNDADEFIEKSTNLTDRYGNLVEEFEIGFIDGDAAALFNACGINQANLMTWFDDIENLDDHEKINLYYLLNIAGCTTYLKTFAILLIMKSLLETANCVGTWWNLNTTTKPTLAQMHRAFKKWRVICAI